MLPLLKYLGIDVLRLQNASIFRSVQVKLVTEMQRYPSVWMEISYIIEEFDKVDKFGVSPQAMQCT